MKILLITTRLFIAAAVLISVASCGVKGPPLPPVADTPMDSDRLDQVASPRPSPTVSPSPRPKRKSR